MKKIYALLLVICFISVLPATKLQAGPGWTYVPTSINHAFIIQGLQMSGIPVASGDYIGAFYTDQCQQYCAGYTVWNGSFSAVTAWGDNPSTPSKEGFSVGEQIIWKVWHAADASTHFATPSYSGVSSGQVYFTASGFNTISVLSFTASAGIQPLSVCVDTNAVSCYGACNGSANLFISGGTPPYGYSWSTGSTSASLSNACAGAYTVTVTDQFGLYSQPVFDWTYTNTGLSHIVSVPVNGVFIFKDSIINGITTVIDTITPSSGDFIGAFYDSLGTPACGGYIQWTGSANSVTVRGDNGLTPQKEGFSVGETLHWRYWNSVESFEVLMDDSVKYNLMFPQQGTFTSSGISALLYLSGSYTPTVAPVIQDTVISMVIQQPAILQASWILSNFNGYQVSSFGASDGYIDITAAGGNPPYTYHWSNGSTAADISGLTAGTYILSITDSKSCSYISDPIILNQVPPANPLVVTATSTNETCAGSCNGMIQLSISNGIPPYVIQWSNAASTATISNLCPGSYSVTVLDQSGNSSSYYHQSFQITGHPAISVISSLSSYGNYQISAFGLSDGSISLTASGGAGTLSYLWSTGQTTSSISFLTAGTYTVTVSDSLQCQSVLTYVLTQPAQVFTIQATSDVQQISCFGACNGSVSVSASNTVAPYYYIWSTGATGANLGSLCPGTYSVTISDSNYPTGLGSPFNWTYTSGGSTQMILVNGGTVKINGINVQSGSYIGAFFTDGALQKCGGYLLYNGSSTTITLKGDNPSISGKDGFLTGDTILWKVWRPSDSITVAMTPAYAAAGGNPALYAPFGIAALNTLNGTYIPNSNTPPLVQSFTLAEPTALTAQIAVNQSISCNSFADGSLQVTIAGGTAPYQQIWSNTSNQLQIGSLSAGNYTVTVTDSKNCQQIQSFSLTQPDPLQITEIVANEACYYCLNGSVQLAISGGTAPFTFNWSQSSTSQNLSDLPAGQYQVTVTDAHACSASESYTLITEPYQRITLPQGWSMFAPFVATNSSSIVDFMAPVVESVIIVKDAWGKVYLPNWNLNQISQMHPGYGYQVSMYEYRQLFIQGSPFAPQNVQILLPYQWSIIGYIRLTPAPVASMFQSLQPYLVLLKDANGAIYWPYMGINDIGNLIPGHAYQVRMNYPQTFVYPAN